MANGFEVLSVDKQDRLSPNGRVSIVYRVWIETDKGANGAVELTEVQYKSDDLKSILAQEAADLDRAFDLASM